MWHDKRAATDVTTPSVYNVARLHSVAAKFVGGLLWNARDAVCANSETDNVLRHDDGHTAFRIIRFMELATEWAGLNAVSRNAYSGKFSNLPPLRNVAEGGRDAGDGLVAGEAEVHEPLAVEGTSHSLQNLDTPLAVFNQLIICR